MMGRYELESDKEMERRGRRMKSPSDRRRRESPGMMRGPPPPIPRDPYDDPYMRVKPEREHIPYKILCVANLNHKVSDNSIRDALMREFTRFGDVSVKVCHDANERFAYIYFRSYEEAREARHAKSRLIMFDKQLEIDPIYERSMPSSSRRRSPTPDYGPPPPSSRNMRGPPPGSPPPHHQSRRQMPPAGPLPPIHSRSSSNNYTRGGGYHMHPDHHAPIYDAPPMHHGRSMHHHSNNNNNGRDNYHNVPHHSSHHVLPPPPMPHHGHNGSGNGHHAHMPSNMQPQSGGRQQRESKKDKFPNYLHHIPPEDDDKSTRTLFVGNLEVTISDQDLKRIFERYGVVEDIDVKRPPPGQGNAYAFIKFLNLDMAHRCKVEMSGQYIGKFQCKIGYGKCTPTTRIWVGGLGPWTSLSHLEREFDRFGAIRKMDFVKGDNHAYIQYDSIDAAQAACQEMRGFPLGGPDKRLRVDFADPEPYNYAFTGSPPRDGQPLVPFPPDVVKGNGSESNFSGHLHKSLNESNNGAPEVLKESEERKPHAGNNGNSAEWWSGDLAQPSSPNGRVPTTKRPHTPEPNTVDLASLSDPGSSKRLRVNAEETNEIMETGDKSPVLETAIAGTLPDSVVSVSDLIKCCAQAWNGVLMVKNSAFPARMLLCGGDPHLVELLMKDANGDLPSLRITQRLRLDPVKLDDVSRRMEVAGPGGHCILLTTPVAGSNNAGGSGSGAEDNGTVQNRPLRNLVSYLKQKDAAGVISLNSAKEGRETQGVLYAFPPCVYAINLLKKLAPNLLADAAKDDFLVIVVVKGTN